MGGGGLGLGDGFQQQIDCAVRHREAQLNAGGKAVFLHTGADAGARCGTDAEEQPAALDRFQLLDIMKADVLMIHDHAASFPL